MESTIQKQIQLALSKLRTVVTFRNNTAQAWVGTPVDKTANTITLRDYRPLHAGLCKGSSDLIGWTVVEVTPEMVGQRLAVFTAVECKGPRGRATPEQINFIEQVNKAGGFGGIAKSEAEAVNIVTRNQTRIV